MVEFDSEDKNVQIYKRLYDGKSNISYKDFFADSHRLQTHSDLAHVSTAGHSDPEGDGRSMLQDRRQYQAGAVVEVYYFRR